MSVYQLTPHPSIAVPERSFAVWNDGFTDDELTNIIKVGEAYNTNSATVGPDGEVIDDIRLSQIAWIPLNQDTQFIYDRLGYIARQLNGQFFDFDIWGFVEDLQYTVYDDDESHYTWHLDRGSGTSDTPRKLSMVLQLSDPSEYEGGDLEIFDGPKPNTIERKKGMVIAFPSFMLHRVTPVTKGTRRTLVVWLTGPRFR
jgi:PKHD-type hydroxylase